MSEQQHEKPLNEEAIIADWQLLFPSPADAVKMMAMANQLIKSGLGKRDKESDLQFCMRVQYCVANDIPLCFINRTYILRGVVSKMVELKMWEFRKAYPKAEFQVIMASDKKMIKQGRISPEHNWVRVEWSVEKAKALNLYHANKGQWGNNILSMYNARCNGQLVDILGGLESQGTGYLSTDELNTIGIEEKKGGH